jgi:hypothetical protein
MPVVDPPSDSDPTDDTASGRGSEATEGAPRWVKVFGVIGVLLIVLFVILLLTGGHGPQRHMLPAAAGESVTAADEATPCLES